MRKQINSFKKDITELTNVALRLNEKVGGDKHYRNALLSLKSAIRIFQQAMLASELNEKFGNSKVSNKTTIQQLDELITEINSEQEEKKPKRGIFG